ATIDGNVHIRDGGLEIWCRHANYSLSGEDGILDDATLMSGQFVASGPVMRKISKGVFQVDEGTFTNCNLDLLNDSSVGHCQFDWKIYGKRLDVTVEEYARIQDALVYAKQIPVFYTPFLIVPIKSQRSTGLLMPKFSYVQNLGNGLEWPF